MTSEARVAPGETTRVGAECREESSECSVVMSGPEVTEGVLRDVRQEAVAHGGERVRTAVRDRAGVASARTAVAAEPGTRGSRARAA